MSRVLCTKLVDATYTEAVEPNKVAAFARDRAASPFVDADLAFAPDNKGLHVIGCARIHRSSCPL
mgnify:FL=1